MNEATLIVFIIFAAVVTISVIIQTCVLVGIYITGRKAQQKMHSLIDDLRIQALPVLSTSRGIVEDLSPKLKTMALNLVESTERLRSMTERVGSTVDDVAERARARAADVDGMLQGTFGQISQVGDAIQHGVAAPLRQINGIVSGVRAGWSVIRQRAPRARGDSERTSDSERASADLEEQDLFV